MKTCFKCGVEKPLTEFYKHGAMADGHLGKCKTCTKVDVKARYYSDPGGKVTEYERKRANLPHRVEARKQYATTSSGKEAFSRARKKYQQANPDKRAAHIILGNAVRDGRVIKPANCSECGADGRIHGHHHDYAKPLDVEWLCNPCHNKRHWGDQQESNASLGA